MHAHMQTRQIHYRLSTDRSPTYLLVELRCSDLVHYRGNHVEHQVHQQIAADHGGELAGLDLII